VIVVGAAPVGTGLPAAQAQGVAAGSVISTLPDVSAIAPDSAWAVGYQAQTTVGPTVTVAEHWNGKSWARVASPDPGPSDNVLDGVSDVARNAAWAVGFYQVGRTARFKTMIAAWNGKTWSKVASPDSPEPDNYLFDVASVSRSDAWAVGYDQASLSSRLRTLLLRWNGRTWSRVASPNPGHGSDSLWAVAAQSARSAWAVGNTCVAQCHGSRGRFGTLVLHWNGRTWSKVPSPSISGANNLLDGVSADGADVWATGYSCHGSNDCLSAPSDRRALMLRWNGHGWSKVAIPHPGQLNELGGVVATSRTNAWTVGDYCVKASKASRCANFERLRTLIMHWNGRKWSQVASPDPGPAGSLAGVTALPSGEAFATGYYCTTSTCSRAHSLILRWDGKHWSG
jgi:hypothetical protein